MRKFIILLAFVLSIPQMIHAKIEQISEQDNPFVWMDNLNQMNLQQLADEADKRRGTENAYSLWAIAELKKRLGDTEAEIYYGKAISAEPNEPGFELFFADYFRNVRGPLKPLFPEAEKHYFEALRKLQSRTKPTCWHFYFPEIKKRVERGLISLYQEDGFPILYTASDIGKSTEGSRPTLFLSTINSYGHSTTDPDRVDDARSFTSEALFASSQSRLNRALANDELGKIVRIKEPFVSYNRLRFRYGDFPVANLFYKYQQIEDAQITNFYDPTKFNKVSLNEFGLDIEKPFNLSPYFDAFLSGAYSRIIREGTIEFLPDDREDINQYQFEGAISRFLGPDKIILNIKYAYQDINPDIDNPLNRDRNIFSATFTYQLLRTVGDLPSFYGSPFGTRGTDLYAGYVNDVENFGGVDVNKREYFVGCTAKGIGPVDITVQPTYFTGEVEGDSSQDNSQYRTNLSFLYRVIDEEQYPSYPPDLYNFMGIYPAFLHFVIPLRHDVAVDGPSYFENFRIGAELDAKFYTVQIGRTSFLASISYGFQRFYEIDKNLNLFSINFSMGF